MKFRASSGLTALSHFCKYPLFSSAQQWQMHLEQEYSCSILPFAMPSPSVIQLLQRKIIPSASEDVAQRIIVARPVMSKRQLPSGVELQKRELIGNRVVVKSRRLYANARLIQAAWPAMQLHEATNAKLICFTGGRSTYPVGDSILNLPPGYFLFVPPGVPHFDGSFMPVGSKSESCELLHLMAYPGALQCWNSRTENGVSHGDPSENFLVRESKTISLFRILIEEVIEKKRGDLQITGHLITALFQMLLRDLMDGRYLASSNMTHEKLGDKSGEFVSALRDYIHHHLHLSLTTEMAAAHMFLSRAQFARRIKQETGKTFGEILTEFRLENAKLLLRESEWTVATIAELVGFKSVAYFHHLFLRQVGSTPIYYRQVNRLKEIPK